MRRQRYLGKGQIAVCMRSGIKCHASELVRDGRIPSLLVLPEWADPPHPQERPYIPDSGEGRARFPTTGADNGPVVPPVLTAEPELDVDDAPFVTLTWTAAEWKAGEPVDTYSVLRDAGDGYVILSDLDVEYDSFGGITGPTLELLDTDVTVDGTYSYKVIAYSHGKTVASNVVTVVGSDFPEPTPDAGPVLEGEFVSINQIDLSWTAVTINGHPVDNYEVYRSDDGGPSALLTTVSGVTLSYSDATTDLDTTGYSYYVRGLLTAGSKVTEPSNVVAFGEIGGIVELYDVRNAPGFPEIGIASSIDVDPVNNRLFLSSTPRTAGNFTSHLKVWDIDENGDVSEVYSETIAAEPGEVDFLNFRSFGALYYPGGSKVHVVRWSGMSTYNYNTATGTMALSSYSNDLHNYPAGRYGLYNGVVMMPGGNPILVTSAGRNSFLQAVAVPVNADQGLIVNTSRETYFNVVAKLTDSETIFYVADSSGNNLTRNSVNAAGTITQLDSVATGMATSGLDDGDAVHCAVYNGYVYAQQVTSIGNPILQPTRRWPILDASTGVLGAAEDGAWDFRADYVYLKTLNNPGGRQCLTHNGHTYFIRASDGDLHKLFRT